MATATIQDIRARETEDLVPATRLLSELPRTSAAAATVVSTRAGARLIFHGRDDRLLVIVGPCSIHDPVAAREYAARLTQQKWKFEDRLLLVMRAYFEKARTTLGWKGLINDPDLDGSFNINKGLRLGRELLLEINEAGLPTATEYINMMTPGYFGDLISWAAIGARTSESQVHRELASGLSCPVGFKNGMNGNLRVAFEAVATARRSHHFLSVTEEGRSAIVKTAGNEDCLVILRGGGRPNYDRASVDAATAVADSLGLPCRLMIDASHGNSENRAERQCLVVEDVARQVAGGEHRIVGIMIESHLVAGRQEVGLGRGLTYGQSITDACVDWDETVAMLAVLAESVESRRSAAK